MQFRLRFELFVGQRRKQLLVRFKLQRRKLRRRMRRMRRRLFVKVYSNRIYRIYGMGNFFIQKFEMKLKS